MIETREQLMEDRIRTGAIDQPRTPKTRHETHSQHHALPALSGFLARLALLQRIANRIQPN